MQILYIHLNRIGQDFSAEVMMRAFMGKTSSTDPAENTIMKSFVEDVYNVGQSKKLKTIGVLSSRFFIYTKLPRVKENLKIKIVLKKIKIRNLDLFLDLYCNMHIIYRMLIIAWSLVLTYYLIMELKITFLNLYYYCTNAPVCSIDS